MYIKNVKDLTVEEEIHMTMSGTADYAFPHSGADERRRLDLFADRLDPLTVRRISLLTLPAGARCLEIGGGRGSIARWLCEYVGADGHVTATDLQTGFLSELSLANLSVLRHDVRTGEFPASSFTELARRTAEAACYRGSH